MMIKVKKFSKIFICYSVIFICVFLSFNFNNFNRTRSADVQPQPPVIDIALVASPTDIIEPEPVEKIQILEDSDNPEEPEPVTYSKKKHVREILLSAVGDFALASNYIKPYAYSFYEYYDLYGPEYFCENVAQFFHESDCTIANLECALTNNPYTRQHKTYSYRGYASYTDIITAAGIDVVNLANNHAYDYSQEGYDDTTEALDKAGIGYCGNGTFLLKNINGINVGFIGILGEHRAGEVKDAIEYLDNNGAELKIVSFHWGNMDARTANGSQVAAARYAIDCGADLVIGHHPHVLQGIELYKGKYIAYSLGNFIFDGNVISDIENRTSIIFQQRFVLHGTEIIESEINIIPILVTSDTQRNNFKPVTAEGAQKENILQKIENRSVH